MTGAEHIATAQVYAEEGDRWLNGGLTDRAMVYFAGAQAHATLALVVDSRANPPVTGSGYGK